MIPRQRSRLLREAVAIRSRVLKEADWRTAEARTLLGATLVSGGRYEKAADLLARSYAVQKARLGRSHRQTIETLHRLLALSEAQAMPDRARFYRAELAASLGPVNSHRSAPPDLPVAPSVRKRN